MVLPIAILIDYFHNNEIVIGSLLVVFVVTSQTDFEISEFR